MLPNSCSHVTQINYGVFSSSVHAGSCDKDGDYITGTVYQYERYELFRTYCCTVVLIEHGSTTDTLDFVNTFELVSLSSSSSSLQAMVYDATKHANGARYQFFHNNGILTSNYFSLRNKGRTPLR